MARLARLVIDVVSVALGGILLLGFLWLVLVY